MLCCENCGAEDETVDETTRPIGITGSGEVIEEEAILCGNCHEGEWAQV